MPPKTTASAKANKLLRAGSAVPAILLATAIAVSLLVHVPVSRRVATALGNVQATAAEQNGAATARFNWDVRVSTSVARATDRELVLNTRDGSTVGYIFDRDAHTVTRIKGTEVSTLLAGVDSVSFSLYESPAVYDQMQAAASANVRVVGLKWTSLDAPKGSSNSQTAIATLQLASR